MNDDLIGRKVLKKAMKEERQLYAVAMCNILDIIQEQTTLENTADNGEVD